MIQTSRSTRGWVVAGAAGLALLTMLAGCAPASPSSGSSASPSVEVSGEVSTSPAPEPSPTPSARPSTTPLGSLSGTWKGTWTNETPFAAVGTFTLTWAQQGTKLYGALGVEGSNCLTAGNVTGTIAGNKISFGAVEGDVTIEYVGTVSDDDRMVGTYETDCGDASGTWTAIRAA
jgi:hypothetical protein